MFTVRASFFSDASLTDLERELQTRLIEGGIIMAIEASKSGERTPKIRLGMVGGGQGAFIGAVHRMAARLDELNSERREIENRVPVQAAAIQRRAREGLGFTHLPAPGSSRRPGAGRPRPALRRSPR